MSRWREVRLGDIVDILGDGLHGTPKYDKDGDYYFINGNNLDGKIVVNEKTNKVGIGEYKKYKKPLNDRTILVSINGTLGRFATYNGEKVVLGKSACYFNVKDNYSKKYINYIVQTDNFKNYLDMNATGTTIKNMGLKQMRKFKFRLPSFREQKAIADVLSTYDRLIENNNRRIEILEKTAEEIYKEWFVRMRFPGHENTKFIKGIPEGWEVKRLEDLAKFKRGKNLVIRDAIPGGVPVIAGGMTPSCYHNESNTNAPVITVSASGANAGYTQLNNVDVWASDCSYIDINDTDLIYYIYLLLKVSYKEILNLQLGSAQPHVYARDLNKFKFLKPEMKLIKRINNYAKDMFEEIKYLNLINQNLIKQRDLLLPRLMNGTIEVK